MPFQINDSKLLKKYNQIWKRVEQLLKVEFDSKPFYGDNDKYIKTKIKIYDNSVNINFQGKKNAKRKITMQVFINNNARFCCQSKEKVLSSNTFGGMQIWSKKDKNAKLYWWWFRKSSSDESDNEDDNDSNDKTELADENDESNE